MRAAVAVMMLALAGCGGDSGIEPEPQPEPAKVVVASVGAPREGFTDEWRVPLALENQGGEGAFRVQFWYRARNSVNPPLELCTESDILDVPEGWSQSTEWEMTCYGRPREVRILTRQPGNIVLKETDRKEIPAP